jgi:hypothetical protein
MMPSFSNKNCGYDMSDTNINFRAWCRIAGKIVN